ncbi:MAG: pantetheine-phosphate adenylyltransferase [Alistipes sp.]|nr:pantetheine-phosphate adenylyltransferase [Alistipes sp.]
MERIAIFPGSFDPFTRGHQAVVEEALKLFDRVVIAIGHNIAKRGLLTTEARKRLIESIYVAEPRVEVTLYTSLTGIEARRVGATAMIRSVRSSADFDYERTIERANREIFPDIATVILLAPAELEYISSSLVRELHAFGQDTSSLLPEGVVLEDYIEET